MQYVFTVCRRKGKEYGGTLVDDALLRAFQMIFSPLVYVYTLSVKVISVNAVDMLSITTSTRERQRYKVDNSPLPPVVLLG